VAAALGLPRAAAQTPDAGSSTAERLARDVVLFRVHVVAAPGTAAAIAGSVDPVRWQDFAEMTKGLDERSRPAFGIGFYGDEQTTSDSPREYSHALCVDVEYGWREVDNLLAPSRGQVSLEGAQGSLLTQVRAARLSWRGEAVDVESREAALRWDPLDLISRRSTVADVSAGTLGVRLHRAEGSGSGLPARLAMPPQIEVRQVRVRNLEWATPRGPGAVTDITFGYAGGAASHRLADLRLTLPGGSLTGAVEIGASGRSAKRSRRRRSDQPALRTCVIR
jgi:hypothetical protein